MRTEGQLTRRYAASRCLVLRSGSEQRFACRSTNWLSTPSNNIFLAQASAVLFFFLFFFFFFFWGNGADTKGSDIRVLEGLVGGGQVGRGASSGDEKVSRPEAPSTGIYRPGLQAQELFIILRRMFKGVLFNIIMYNLYLICTFP
jgi:hypothetical protein